MYIAFVYRASSRLVLLGTRHVAIFEDERVEDGDGLGEVLRQGEAQVASAVVVVHSGDGEDPSGLSFEAGPGETGQRQGAKAWIAQFVEVRPDDVEETKVGLLKKMSSKVFSMKARLPRRGRQSWATCSSDSVAPSFATVAVARSWANFRKSFVTTRFSAA